jgi:NADH:ubiquinone oxidoreductase subunit 4 (subunit M)
MAIMAVLIASLVWLGLFPQPVLNTADPVLRSLQSPAAHSITVGR